VLPFDARVNAEKLRELLAEAHESERLEYIARCNMDDRRDVVELAREIGALAARGGYLVIGVDSQGQPTGTLDSRMADLFDDATLRDKLARYLPDVEVHVGRHERSDGPIVVLAVMPHADGALVFAADGAYDHHGKQAVAFRRGEIFVRHGSKSERPNQSDIDRIRVAAVEHARLWVQQLDKIADLVVELGRIVDREVDTHPDGRLVRLGVPTQVPVGRERLKASLALFEHVGGPELPATRKLAQEAHHVFANQLRADVSAAAYEIAFVAQSEPGGGLAPSR
jgi:hypothetical protein